MTDVQWSGNPQYKQNRHGWAEFHNPANAGANYLKMYECHIFGAFPDGIDQAVRSGYLSGQDTTTFDGLEIFVESTWAESVTHFNLYAYA